jgi:hypothetical protein
MKDFTRVTSVAIKPTSGTTKKSMQFAEYCTITLLDRPKTDAELKCTWLTDSEMKMFKREAGTSAREILKLNPAAVKEYIRNSFEVDKSNIKFSGIESIVVVGLENLFDEDVARMLGVCRSLTVRRVLKELSRQQRTGEVNAELLAQCSARSSMFSVLWRRRIARMNAADRT